MENNIQEGQYSPVQNQLVQSYPKFDKKSLKFGKILTYFSYFLVGVLFIIGFGIAGFYLGFSQSLSDKGKLEEDLFNCQMKAKIIPTPTPTPKPQILLSYADEKNNFLFDYPPKWVLVKETDGPKLSTESAQLKFWVGIDKKYAPTATESAKIKTTTTGTIEVNGKKIETKEYVFSDEKLVLSSQISDIPKINVYLVASSQELYEAGKTIIESLKFQRVSPF